MAAPHPSPARPGSQASLRLANRQRVLRSLQASGTLTQAEVARSTGLAPATVSNIVRALAEEGLVSAEGPARRGRILRLARAAGVAVGVDIGHRHVTVCVADLSHTVLAERRRELEPSVAADQALQHAAALLREALDEVGVGSTDVIGIGMGLPAPIDAVTREVGAPSILPGWVGLNASELASEHLGQPVVIDNDANLGVLAEHLWGAGRDVDDLAYLKLSEGVGAGLVVSGQLFRGAAGTAGEIGHTAMDEFGAVCRCGNRGCLETLISARAVLQLLEPTRGVGLTIAEVVRMAQSGDHACERVLHDSGRHTGQALANLANLFNPSLVLIGGELALAGELLLAPMREIVRRSAIPSAGRGLRIQLAELGPRASVLGAVALVLTESARTVGPVAV